MTTNKPLYVHLPRLHVDCLYPAIHPWYDHIFSVPFKVQVTSPLNSSPTLWVERIAHCSRSTCHFIADLYYSTATQAWNNSLWDYSSAPFGKKKIIPTQGLCKASTHTRVHWMTLGFLQGPERTHCKTLKGHFHLTDPRRAVLPYNGGLQRLS